VGKWQRERREENRTTDAYSIYVTINDTKVIFGFPLRGGN
jgi:hypothetical protein